MAEARLNAVLFTVLALFCMQAASISCNETVLCQATSECHNPGDCIEGTCTNPAKENGAVCSVGICQDGVCVKQKFQPEIKVDDGSLVFQVGEEGEIMFKRGNNEKRLSDIEADAVSQSDLTSQLQSLSSSLNQAIGLATTNTNNLIGNQNDIITRLEEKLDAQSTEISTLHADLDDADDRLNDFETSGILSQLNAVNIKVESKGWCLGSLLRISRNNVQINIPIVTGMTFVTFDKDTYEVKEARKFATFSSPTEVTAMASWINGLEDGTPIAGGIYDEGTRLMTDEAYEAIERLGSAHIRNIRYREGWSIVGRVGSPRGSAAESNGASTTGEVPDRCKTDVRVSYIPAPSVTTKTFFGGSVGHLIDREIAERTEQLAINSISNLDLYRNVLEVTSNGACSGNNFEAKINGYRMNVYERRGVNMLVIHPETLDVLEEVAFDTHDGSATADTSGKLYDYIDALAPGTIVLAGVRDEGNNGLTLKGKQALEMIGSRLIHRLGYRIGWAIIGIKGAKPGTVPEDLGLDYSKSETTDCNAHQIPPRPVKTLTMTLWGGSVGSILQSTLQSKVDVTELNEELDARSADPDSAVFSVMSAGYCLGNFGELRRNGEMIDVSPAPANNKRGIAVAAFDSQTFELIDDGTWDTYGSSAQSTALAHKIYSWPKGTIVAAYALDSITGQLNEEIKIALEYCGSGLIRGIVSREAWAMLGVVGSKPGSATEDHGSDLGEDGSTVDKTRSSCTSGQFDPRQTALLKRRFYTSDFINYLHEQSYYGTESGFSRDRLVLYLDASSYRGGDLWLDLSGSKNHANIRNANSPPIWRDAYGGFFDFSTSAYFFVPIPQLAKMEDYTVTWCGVQASGNGQGGVSRGQGWTNGNHLIGWKSFAFFQGQPRPDLGSYVKDGDSFCVTHTHDHQTKTFNIYIDGRYYYTAVYGSPGQDAPVGVWAIGARNNGQHQYTGGITSVVIHARVLNHYEVAETVDALGARLGLSENHRRPQYPPSSGLKLYLDASTYSPSSDGNQWKDLSGNSNHATLNNLNKAPTYDAAFGGSFQFATDKAFSISMTSMQSSSYTVFFCAPNTGGNQYGGVSRGSSNAAGNHRIGFGRSIMFSSGGEFAIYRGVLDNGEPICVASSADKDHLITRTYANGKLISQETFTQWGNVAEWRFGQRTTGDSQFYGGLGVVLIYDRVLSPNEVEQIYDTFGHRYGLP